VGEVEEESLEGMEGEYIILEATILNQVWKS
jgi:hypothetical protein